MIRGLWLYPAALALTFFLAAGVVLSSLFRSSKLACRCRRYPRLWARLLIRWSGTKVEVEGLDRVDWDRPMVMVANHQSWFDVFAILAYIPANLRFVAKEELGRIPIFGRAWKECGHVSVDRSNRSEAIASLERAASRIRDESLAVIFFPEGTRSTDGRLQTFKKGAFVLALQTGVPLVPLGIAGSRAVMPKGSFRIRPGHIKIRVGEPIPTSGLEHQDRGRLLDSARNSVLELMEDPDALAVES